MSIVTNEIVEAARGAWSGYWGDCNDANVAGSHDEAYAAIIEAVAPMLAKYAAKGDPILDSAIVEWMDARGILPDTGEDGSIDMREVIEALDNHEHELLAAKPAVQGEAVEIEYPEFNSHGMGCGLEDRFITDRYEAMRYGFEEALDQVATIVNNLGPLYTHPVAAAVPNEATPEDAPGWVKELSDSVTWAAGFNACRKAMLAVQEPPR